MRKLPKSSDEDENIPGPDEDYVPVTPKHLLPLMNPFPSEDDDLALEELMEQLEAEIAEEVKHKAVERVNSGMEDRPSANVRKKEKRMESKWEMGKTTTRNPARSGEYWIESTKQRQTTSPCWFRRRSLSNQTRIQEGT